MTFVTLKVFDQYIDAHLLKTKLESEGIACYLFDENIVSAYLLYSFAVGGIKLKVAAPDLAKAQFILKDIEQSDIYTDVGERLCCPQCKATDLYLGFKSFKTLRGVLALLISLLFMTYPLYYNNVYRCKTCSKEFR